MSSSERGSGKIVVVADRPDYALIELMFFGYRDFVAEADRVLAAYGFGRAHHRVLHFVNRNPGLIVARLLDILGITKQALARVLKELIEGGFIEQASGETDRRQRLLTTTAKGQRLARELADVQTRRIRRALNQSGAEHRHHVEAFLLALVEDGDRPVVADILGASGG
jgi:DNA-binding MarR family transcriptional regulator